MHNLIVQFGRTETQYDFRALRFKSISKLYFKHILISSCNKAMKVKTILNEYGFGSAWLNQSVENQNKFIVLFERRTKDNFIQHCFAEIEASTRCRTYKDIKSIHDIEPYLQREIHSSLRSAFTKLRLSSHRFMVERGKWMKPKVQYIDRKCTLCNDNDIQDEYHIVLKCA